MGPHDKRFGGHRSGAFPTPSAPIRSLASHDLGDCTVSDLRRPGMKEGCSAGFDGIESLWKGVPGSELPLNDRKTKTANTQFAYAA